MLPESKLDRVIYLAVIPVLAAVLGSIAGALFQAQVCSVVGASEIQSLLENTQMDGTQKLAFMETYMEITGRPWDLARSAMNLLLFGSGVLLSSWVVSGGFRRNK